MQEKVGYIYIITNDCFKDNIVKIFVLMVAVTIKQIFLQEVKNTLKPIKQESRKQKCSSCICSHSYIR